MSDQQPMMAEQIVYRLTNFRLLLKCYFHPWALGELDVSPTHRQDDNLFFHKAIFSWKYFESPFKWRKVEDPNWCQSSILLISGSSLQILGV